MSYKSMVLTRQDDDAYIVSNAQFSIARPETSGIDVSITKKQFITAVNQELAATPYIPSIHNSLRNPYTGKVICSQADYEEYIREYTFHRLCEEGAVKAYNYRVASELRQAAAKYEEAQSRTRRKYRIITLLLCLALVSSLIYIAVIGLSAGYGQASTGTVTVYISDSGKRYHRANCTYLKSSTPISLAEAKSEGYSPCSKCNPPR